MKKSALLYDKGPALESIQITNVLDVSHVPK
jgi:hypothetical protein